MMAKNTVETPREISDKFFERIRIEHIISKAGDAEQIPELSIENQKEKLAVVKERLETVGQLKEMAIRRFDEEIDAIKNQIEVLEKDVELLNREVIIKKSTQKKVGTSKSSTKEIKATSNSSQAKREGATKKK